MAQEERSVLSLIPDDTPAYMAPAWLSCIEWAIGKPEILETFRAETGNRWRPARSGIEDAIDRTTGADWAFVKAFVEWANVAIWGDIEDPDCCDEDQRRTQ